MLFTTLYNYFVPMLVQMLVQILTRFLPAQHLPEINLIEPYSIDVEVIKIRAGSLAVYAPVSLDHALRFGLRFS
jgi:hypothetical protein